VSGLRAAEVRRSTGTVGRRATFIEQKNGHYIHPEISKKREKWRGGGKFSGIHLCRPLREKKITTRRTHESRATKKKREVKELVL